MLRRVGRPGCAGNGEGVVLAGAGAGAGRVQLRLRSVRGRPPPRDRHRRGGRRHGGRACGRRRLVLRDRADGRADARDPDARRLLRDPAPSRLRVRRAWGGGGRRGRGRLRRLERSFRAGRPVRASGRPPGRRAGGVRRPAPLPTAARAAIAAGRAAGTGPGAEDGTRASSASGSGGDRAPGRGATGRAADGRGAAKRAVAGTGPDTAAAAGSAAHASGRSDDACRCAGAGGGVCAGVPWSVAPGLRAGAGRAAGRVGAEAWRSARAAAGGPHRADWPSARVRGVATSGSDRTRPGRAPGPPPLSATVRGGNRRCDARDSCRWGVAVPRAEAAQARSYH
jgi:hypothetical protein